MKTRGMTLVEVTVALALAGMLLTGVLHITASLTRRSRWVDRQIATTSPAEDMERIIAADIVNAEQYKGANGSLALRTTACLDGKNSELIHMPCEVHYRVETAAGESWLIRTQASLDGLVRSDLVGPAVTSISMEAALGVTADADGSQGWLAVPDAPTIAISMAPRENGRPRELRFSCRKW